MILGVGYAVEGLGVVWKDTRHSFDKHVPTCQGSGLGLGVKGSGFRVGGLGFRVQVSTFLDQHAPT